MLDRDLENTALRQELEGWLGELPEERRPQPQDNLSLYWETVRDSYERFQQGPPVNDPKWEETARQLKKALGRDDATPEELVELRQDLLDYKNGNGDNLLKKHGHAPAKLKLPEKLQKFKEVQLLEPGLAQLLETARARGVDFEQGMSRRLLSPEQSLEKKYKTIKLLTAYEELGGDDEYTRLGGSSEVAPVYIEIRLKMLQSFKKLARHEEEVQKNQ